ncbi:MAG: serine--tRNA ligase [Saprospiraceae bacterium]|nr:serine--tRNA ligase [Saprospiraceae bacterium]
MLQIKTIHERTDDVKNALKKRGFSAEELNVVDEVVNLDNQRKATQTKLDAVLAQINSKSKAIGGLFKSGKVQEANDMKKEVTDLKSEKDPLEDQLRQITVDIQNILFKLPNMPHAKVPEGLSEDDNVVVKDWDKPLPSLIEGAKAHWDLAELYNIIDFELGVKITGSGFPLYRGKGAIFQRALINFFLDEAREAGYEEIIPPLLVNEASGIGTGSLPDKEAQMYHMEKDNLFLIPTAEVPVTNIVRNVILKEDDFPIKFCAYTPCFRREAGAHGSDVRGLNRVHQFDKIEIVQVEHPDRSHDTLDNMVSYVEGLLNKLELPYRILRLCSGDLTFASALTYDFEVFSAAQEKWLEVSSVSNFETFQTNRMKCRYKDANGKTQLAHTLNGSALALARIVAALLENNQTENGINVPEVLRPYTRFDLID